MMIRKTFKYNLLYACFSLYFVFFVGWMQFHHGHDAEEYLDLGTEVTRVDIVSIHHHSVKDIFPLIEHHNLVVKPHFDCPLCAVNWMFHGLLDAQKLVAADHSNLQLTFAREDLSRKPKCNYFLRAPPLS